MDRFDEGNYLQTSQSQPLNIAEIRVGPCRMGLTSCPGKTEGTSIRDPRSRDLGTDISAIRRWGADAVVSLVEEREMQALGVPHLGTAVRRAGMIWHHLPIADFSAPDIGTLESWAEFSPTLHQTLDRGGRVLFHCQGGRGRSGMIAAL